eukprot:6175690-Amphidinium_carterae.2
MLHVCGCAGHVQATFGDADAPEDSSSAIVREALLAWLAFVLVGSSLFIELAFGRLRATEPAVVLARLCVSDPSACAWLCVLGCSVVTYLLVLGKAGSAFITYMRLCQQWYLLAWRLDHVAHVIWSERGHVLCRSVAWLAWTLSSLHELASVLACLMMVGDLVLEDAVSGMLVHGVLGMTLNCISSWA